MNKINCFVPFSGAAQAEKTVKGLQETGLVNNIYLLALPDVTENLPGCSTLHMQSIQSSTAMRYIAGHSDAEYTLIYTKYTTLELGLFALERMIHIAEDSGAGMVYADRYQVKEGKQTNAPVIDYQFGSLRDDFDFGSVLLFRTNAFKEAAARMNEDEYKFAGLYDLRLKVSQKASLVHINEYLYSEIEDDTRKSGEKIFDYVDPKNRDRQIEMEQEQQKELLAGISHDIRTPLTAIKAYAEGVRDGIAPTEEQQKRYMGIILKRANDLDSMLEELFLITTLNYKKESRPSERIELGQFVRDFVEDHLAPYQSKGLEIKARIATETPFINANPQLLQRVLQNVLNNSAKYKMTDIGHCVIDVTSDDDFVYCVISDDGPGVPPESLERLMRPFYRVDSSRTNPQEGSGLGLSIIRRIMEIFEGRVMIENVRPHGLRIILEFPKQGEES